ncbi:SNF2 family N-terminal domain-containing protein [Apiospora saccharicola]|uniref:SNF2 family N-terminal domain-containing protein n=1 Tax=Apiospora saccharicola TaxID=335842 RepID=A0ABR1UJX3_9PEZI
MALAAKLTLDSSSANINYFNIAIQNERVVVTMQDGSRFGYLADRFFKPFRELQHISGDVSFEAVGVTTDIIQTLRRAAKHTDARCFIDINIYGPCDLAESVGKKLVKYKLWLQLPDNYQKGESIYMNPHTISFPDVEEQMAAERLAAAEDTPSSQTQNEEEVLDQVMSEVHDRLSRDKGLGMEAGGQRLTTELLPHQKRALKYMLERESGEIPDGYRLWEETKIGGKVTFIHKVTGTRAPTQPEERGGGVLADEMGTGKSLSTLALITRTLDSAQQWRQEQQDTESHTAKVGHFAAATLVIVPSARLILIRHREGTELIANWANEIERHAGMALSTLKYHGTEREKDPEGLMGYDVILTTYSTLSSDYRKRESVLHRIGWYRVVLDEAHYIRNHLTVLYHACCGLEAYSRWCLSGTPIQNRLEDIGTLFSFLRAEPFHNRAEFRRSIVLPFENLNKTLARDRLILLYDSLVLRRSKDTCITDVPDPEEEFRQLSFSSEEAQQYDRTLQVLKRRLANQAFLQPGQMATLGTGSDPGFFPIDGSDFRKTSLYQSLVDENASRFSLFHAMMQLRIFCNHGTYQNWFSWKKHKETSDTLEEREIFQSHISSPRSRGCDGCSNPLSPLDLNKPMIFGRSCRHILCMDCINDTRDESVPEDSHSQCPICRSFASTLAHEVQRATMDESGDVNMTRNDDDASEVIDPGSTQTLPYFRKSGTSTKINALIEDIGNDPLGTKRQVIVFSCWTRTLDLIQRCMRENKIDPLRIDGSSLYSQRRKVIKHFEEDPSAQVLLMTTGTGAHGLNLTAANRIFIFELQWNPSIERQAIARAIRIGQTRQVRVTRYLIKDTVEQAIYSQQKRKRKAAAMGFPQEASTGFTLNMLDSH